MPYNIYKSDGTTVSIPDGAVSQSFNDTTANSGHGIGIQLIGQNATGYVAPIAQSMLQITENFASTFPPNDTTSLQGQLWFEKVSPSAGNIHVKVGPANWAQILSGTTSVTPGLYTNANIVVDMFGRITSAANGSGGSSTTGTVTSVTVDGTPGRITGGGTITASGTITLDLAATAVTAGSYTNTSLTIDAYGRITAASTGTITPTGLGYGQTWQSVPRSVGVTYYNTTGKPIVVFCWSSRGGATAGGGTLYVSGFGFPTCYSSSSNTIWAVQAIVPPDAAYSATFADGLAAWIELR